MLRKIILDAIEALRRGKRAQGSAAPDRRPRWWPDRLVYRHSRERNIVNMRLTENRGLDSNRPVVIFVCVGVKQAAPMRIAYSAISGAMSSLWVAQEGGYFKREGLDTELLYIGGGSLLIQAMMSGDVPFAYGPSVPVINASLRGADLVLIGNTGNSSGFLGHVAAGNQTAGSA